MKKIYNFRLLTLFITLLSIQLNAEETNKQNTDRWSFISKDVADINGTKITKEDFISYMKTVGNPKEFYSLSGKPLELYAHEMLEKMINQIILAKLAENAGFTPGFDLIKSETEKIIKTMSEKEKNNFLDYLTSQKMNIDDFCRRKASDPFTARQFAIDTWFDTKIKKNIKVTNEEIKDFYIKSEDLISVSQILIKYDGNSPEEKAKAKKRAEEILTKIRAGGDFRKFAANDSSCSSSMGGIPGALPEFGRGQMVQEFEDAAFALPVGGVSDVIETPFGFHIIKVDKKRKRPLPSLDSIKDQIREEITTIKGQDQVISKLKNAKKDWKITITAFKK